MNCSRSLLKKSKAIMRSELLLHLPNSGPSFLIDIPVRHDWDQYCVRISERVSFLFLFLRTDSIENGKFDCGTIFQYYSLKVIRFCLDHFLCGYNGGSNTSDILYHSFAVQALSVMILWCSAITFCFSFQCLLQEQRYLSSFSLKFVLMDISDQRTIVLMKYLLNV